MDLFLSCIGNFSFKQDVKLNITYYYFYKKRKIYMFIYPNTISGRRYKNLTMVIASGKRNSGTRRKQEKGDIFITTIHYCICYLFKT